MQSPLGPRVWIAGRERDYFSGTGYLGLHNHPAVTAAAMEAIQNWGMATGTSRGGYGEHAVYDALEAQAREFFAAERVLYYPSGYMSAIILAQGLKARCERIFMDEWAHYSLWDGARSTGMPIHAFRHLDPQSLADTLKSSLQPGERPLILSDGLFPISGEIAPVPDYLAVLEAFEGGWLGLDDAHATGALGANGRGTLEHYQINHPRAVAGHTLSKAVGGYGGLTAGTEPLMEELRRGSRVYVGASPPPLPAAAAACQALKLASQNERRLKLWENVAHAKNALRGLGWTLDDNPAPIICLRARPGVDLAGLKDALFEDDICVAHVTGYSSTPEGGALRVAIFATHSFAQIDRLVEVLGGLV